MCRGPTPSAEALPALQAGDQSFQIHGRVHETYKQLVAIFADLAVRPPLFC